MTILKGYANILYEGSKMQKYPEKQPYTPTPESSPFNCDVRPKIGTLAIGNTIKKDAQIMDLKNRLNGAGNTLDTSDDPSVARECLHKLSAIATELNQMGLLSPEDQKQVDLNIYDIQKCLNSGEYNRTDVNRYKLIEILAILSRNLQ